MRLFIEILMLLLLAVGLAALAIKFSGPDLSEPLRYSTECDDLITYEQGECLFSYCETASGTLYFYHCE